MQRDGRAELLDDHRPADARAGRAVCFDAEAGYVETPVVQRDSLAPGSSISGPVIVEEFGSTVPIHPGFEVRVDEYLDLIVTRSEA